MAVLRERSQRLWEVELGVTETSKMKFKGGGPVHVLYSYCKKKQCKSRAARGVAVARHSAWLSTLSTFHYGCVQCPPHRHQACTTRTVT